ncbi:MAG: glycosyltransferase [Pseudomonadota bacterium]
MAFARANRLIWRSILNFPIGYAFTSRHIALALEQNNAEVIYRYAYGPGTVFPVEEAPVNDDSTLLRMSKRIASPDDTVVVYAQADVFEFGRGKYRVGFTMFESDGLPKVWVTQCNLMDEVWVPSSFNVNTFSNAGVTAPIRVVPLGLDPECYTPQGPSYRNEEIFSFLSVFEWRDRKAPELLITAFNDEFGIDEPVGLFCKVWSADPKEVSRRIAELKLRKKGGKVFFSINNRLDDEQMAALYRSADCFVLPTRGEGWGMPFLEAMACGLPVIATRWGAHLDFLNDENAYLIEIDSLIAADSTPPYVGTKWANPSYEHLRRLLRTATKDLDASKEKARNSAEHVRKVYTWDATAKRIISLLT